MADPELPGTAATARLTSLEFVDQVHRDDFAGEPGQAPPRVWGRYIVSVLKGWFRRRLERRDLQAQTRQRLHDEYMAKLESRQPDVLDAARDYGDHDFSSWRADVTMSLAFGGILLFAAVVAVLIGIFTLLERAIGG